MKEKKMSGGKKAKTSSASRRPPSRARRPSVSVVGVGRLGTALARALDAAGYDVRAVVAEHLSHARRASKLIGSRPLPLSPAHLDLLPPSDVLIIAVPDDSLPEVADALADAFERVDTAAAPRAPVALHASGALSSEALAPLRERGFAVGSMHPLASVSGDAEAGAESLRAAFYCVEGDEAALLAARRIVRDLGAKSFSIRAEDKALYHAAAVMTSGHTVALFDIAARMLARCGLDDKSARRVLLPLLESTLSNLSRHTPARALTGTFARADVATVRKHLVALERLAGGEAPDAYALLGRHSLRLAEDNGADAEALDEIARALNEFGNR